MHEPHHRAVCAIGSGWLVPDNDTGAARTELRFRILGGAPLPAALDGDTLSWGTQRLSADGDLSLPSNSRLQLELAPGRVLATEWLSAAVLRTSIIGPERLELGLEGTCTIAPRPPNYEATCTSLKLSAPLLQQITRLPYEAGTFDAIASTGEGALGFVGQALWEWTPLYGWLLLTRQTERLPRSSITWDSARRRLVAFGGERNGVPVAETHEWDGNSWLVLSPVQQPPPRERAALGFDPKRGRVVLFGGVISDGGAGGDVWEWDGTNWQFADTAGGPGEMAEAVFAWDGTREELLLFHRSTWSWNGVRWALLQLDLRGFFAPPWAMEWDPEEQRVILAHLNTSFAWNGIEWTQLSISQSREPINVIWARDAGVFAIAGTDLADEVRKLEANTWKKYSTPVVGGAGAMGADGGALLLAKGRMREWGGGGWRSSMALPDTDFLSAAKFGPDILALGLDDAGVAATWRLREGAVSAVASGVPGQLISSVDGELWLLHQNTAFTWIDDGWTAAPWPEAVTPRSAAAAADGGFYITTTSEFLHVDPNGGVLTLGPSKGQTLIPMRGRVPAALEVGGGGSMGGVAFWDEVDASWQPVSKATKKIDSYLGQDSRGRSFFGQTAPIDNSVAFVWDPWRVLGSRCVDGWECESGSCVDGRCCNAACIDGVCAASAAPWRMASACIRRHRSQPLMAAAAPATIHSA